MLNGYVDQRSALRRAGARGRPISGTEFYLQDDFQPIGHFNYLCLNIEEWSSPASPLPRRAHPPHHRHPRRRDDLPPPGPRRVETPHLAIAYRSYQTLPVAGDRDAAGRRDPRRLAAALGVQTPTPTQSVACTPTRARSFRCRVGARVRGGAGGRKVKAVVRLCVLAVTGTGRATRPRREKRHDYPRGRRITDITTPLGTGLAATATRDRRVPCTIRFLRRRLRAGARRLRHRGRGLRRYRSALENLTAREPGRRDNRTHAGAGLICCTHTHTGPERRTGLRITDPCRAHRGRRPPRRGTGWSRRRSGGGARPRSGSSSTAATGCGTDACWSNPGIGNPEV